MQVMSADGAGMLCASAPATHWLAVLGVEKAGRQAAGALPPPTAWPSAPCAHPPTHLQVRLLLLAEPLLAGGPPLPVLRLAVSQLGPGQRLLRIKLGPPLRKALGGDGVAVPPQLRQACLLGFQRPPLLRLWVGGGQRQAGGLVLHPLLRRADQGVHHGHAQVVLNRLLQLSLQQAHIRVADALQPAGGGRWARRGEARQGGQGYRRDCGCECS